MAKFSRKTVWTRARGRCEYCLLPAVSSVLPHEIDHIRAKKHRGVTSLANTCLACAYCNGAKGTNAAGYDPITNELVPLFNPRADRWEEHFSYSGAVLQGRTSRARATIEVLRINDPDRVNHRLLLLAAGTFSLVASDD